ncbi:MAG: hypothetical protein KKE77_08570 [Alphaproteobacteria bacterium]|nr:hypothetical protein [Alphaproteobacteria bacterium]MBU2341279.1 hypothetical protein [Alphaproteobacteria bacterium]
MALPVLPKGMARFFDTKARAPSGDLPPIPLGGTRQQAMNRLQVGVGGVLGVLMLVGLASVIQNQADEVERNAVPEAASTNIPEPRTKSADPLVEAGVVPDLPATPTPSPTGSAATAPVMPEQGTPRPDAGQ